VHHDRVIRPPRASGRTRDGPDARFIGRLHGPGMHRASRQGEAAIVGARTAIETGPEARFIGGVDTAGMHRASRPWGAAAARARAAARTGLMHGSSARVVGQGRGQGCTADRGDVGRTPARPWETRPPPATSPVQPGSSWPSLPDRLCAGGISSSRSRGGGRQAGPPSRRFYIPPSLPYKRGAGEKAHRVRDRCARVVHDHCGRIVRIGWM
jgi:hypothetical protein